MTNKRTSAVELKKLAALIRYYILVSTSKAGSGHPTSSLSAADLMTVLWFGGYYHFDFENQDNPLSDRLIFSKGHATPLYYSLFLAAGVIIPDEILNLRQFDSPFEGHPTPRFKYTEAATGSLGQGLSVGVGMALAQQAQFKAQSEKLKAERVQSKKLKPNTYHLTPKTYVLLGDGECAEGSVWEAANIAGYYKLSNLVAIVDVNRLGQSGETMLGWDTKTYEQRFRAFGWDTVVIDGHDYSEIASSYQYFVAQRKRLPSRRKIASQGNTSQVTKLSLDSSDACLRRQGGGINKPFAIIAKTIKGKGVSFLENKEGWHGKPLPQDLLDKALKELGNVDLKVRGEVKRPESRIKNKELRIKNILTIYNTSTVLSASLQHTTYNLTDKVATRKAYGLALAKFGEDIKNLVVLDGDVKNSTYAEIFAQKFPNRFFEMFIAEQNMVGVAAGFSRLGFIPFVSSFACFLTRNFDQIRMAAISRANIKFCGSHAGVSIGEDGPSQMGLEDIAMFRAVYDSVILYPADAVSTEKLLEEMIKHSGICYLRTTRSATPVIYGNDEKFPIGGCKVHYIKLKTQMSKLKTITADAGSRCGGTTQNSKPTKILIIAAGVTLFEALKAQKILAEEGIEVAVVDCYSIKPIDETALRNLVTSTSTRAALGKTDRKFHVITVEDHWFDGGLGDAVLNVFSQDAKVKIYKLAVSKMPKSGKPKELFAYEKIDAAAIVSQVKTILKKINYE